MTEERRGFVVGRLSEPYAGGGGLGFGERAAVFAGKAHGGAAAGQALDVERGHQRVEALALLLRGDYVGEALCHG